MKYSLHNFKKGLDKLNIQLTDLQIEQFITFYEKMVEKNKVMNLTSITEWEEVVQKHFLDSLEIVRVLDIKTVSSIIDVGTGAGFPGVPLKIAFPNIKITLMDSLNKRIKFLNEVIEECKLENIEAIHSRAEDLARKDEYREKYDLVVSRAVANLSSLSEYCIPFTKIKGKFISYKSGDIDKELSDAQNAIRLLGGSVEEVVKFQLNESDISRAFVIIKKEKMCSKKYPRKAGMATSNPLK